MQLEAISGNGVMDNEKDMSSLTGSTAGLGFTTNSVGYYSSDGSKYIADSYTLVMVLVIQQIILLGIALDMTSATKTVTFYKNTCNSRCYKFTNYRNRNFPL